MMYVRAKAVVFLGSFLLAPVDRSSARDITYTPVSPAFGGSPLNGSYILGLAGANNDRYTESPRSRRERQAREAALGSTSDPVQMFQRQITASLLTQIATSIGQQILGENARDSGTFSVGGTVVNFRREGGQVKIDIAETATGNRTSRFG